MQWDGTREVTVEGVGLHLGVVGRVVLREATGPVRLCGARVDELEVVSTARATTVQARSGARRGGPVGTVEHMFAAFAGLSIYEGVEILVDGPEIPLLDGGATRWCEALSTLAPSAGAPALRVTRPFSLEVGPSHYAFAPSFDVHVEAHLETDDPRLASVARWHGDPVDFQTRVAPARTFAFSREIEELVRRDLARHVDPASVVLVAPDAIHYTGRPFESDEPARHKLLDLLGDLYLAGGPPVGRVVAHRPGHASNTRALRRALEEGVLAPLVASASGT